MRKHNTTLGPIQKRRGRIPVIDPLAPCCLTCRGVMSTSGTKGSRWQCRKTCKTSIYKRTVGELRGTGDAVKDHPCCVKCRRAMAKHGADYKGITIWRCTYCKQYANAERSQVQTRRECKSRRIAKRKPVLKLDHPQCVVCRWQMKRTGTTKRRLLWECHLCGATCAISGAQRERKPSQTNGDTGDDLITFIDSKLTNYSVEMREELRGEIAIALLTHAKIGGVRLTRASLTPATVRLIAKPIYKQQPNRFRDVSLDHRYGEDGQRLEERLVG